MVRTGRDLGVAAEDGWAILPMRRRLFRRESGRLISVLTRILGPGNLQLAEDVLQEAFVAALGEWADRGLPENPSGWLFTAARNRAIDTVRRERTRRTFAADLTIYLDSEWTLARTVDEAFGEVTTDEVRAGSH
jgi:RNA polymerase sigma-70 factor (ECF subfamily)